MTPYSERIYSVLCSLIGDEEVISYNRAFSDVYLSDMFTLPKESLQASNLFSIINTVFSGCKGNTEEGENQGPWQTISNYRMLLRAFNIPIQEEQSQMLDNLPAMLSNLQEFTTNAFQTFSTVVSQVPKEMRDRYAAPINEIRQYNEIITQKFAYIEGMCGKNAHLQNYENLLPIIKESWIMINSGSRAEGFDFISSDFDVMMTTSKVKVVQTMPHKYDTQSTVVLLMEKENTRPGFVRLQATHDLGILMFLFTSLGNKHYLSNKLLKLFSLNVFRSGDPDFRLHGPCISTENEMADLALTLSSDAWSNDAIGCVHRMIKCGWPPKSTICEIVKDGFLFVPIGNSKSEYEEIEWRMSFSLAEKRLVHSMNHTQFLVYALLKIFLKDVIGRNKDVKGYLCSYFMKTAVFWEIMDTKIPWNPSYLLFHFWNCFRRVIRWVSHGYCPNFFIPDNNMFFAKIHGDAQQMLLKYLGSLFGEGYGIIKQIHLLMFEFDKWIGVPNQSIEHGLNRSKVILDLTTTFSFNCNRTTKQLIKALRSVDSEIVSDLCNFLRLLEINLSCNRNLFEQKTLEACNRIKYAKEKSLIQILKLSSPDCIRSKIFLAMYFYECGRYESAICLLYMALQLYDDVDTFLTFPFNQLGYNSVGGNLLSIVEGMRRHTVCQIPFESATCISEVVDDFSFANDGAEYQSVPPLPLAHFLLFMCHFRMNDHEEARKHLLELEHHNLHCMGEYDELFNLRRTWRLSKEAISWELLGIAQEIISDFRHAMNL